MADQDVLALVRELKAASVPAGEGKREWDRALAVEARYYRLAANALEPLVEALTRIKDAPPVASAEMRGIAVDTLGNLQEQLQKEQADACATRS